MDIFDDTDITHDGFDYIVNHDKHFIYLCHIGKTDEVKMYYIKHVDDIDIHTECEAPFRLACSSGHLDTVQYLLEIGENTNLPIDIHIMHELAFRMTCFNRHEQLAKWLFDTSIEKDTPIDYRILEDHIFRTACTNNNVKIADWLQSLCPNYTIEYECPIVRNKITGFEITDVYKNINRMLKDTTTNYTDIYIRMIDMLRIVKIRSTYNIHECLICMNDIIDMLELPCHHKFCPECLLLWEGRTKKNRCCYCNRYFIWNNCTFIYTIMEL